VDDICLAWEWWAVLSRDVAEGDHEVEMDSNLFDALRAEVIGGKAQLL
jgi:hypothetical protein